MVSQSTNYVKKTIMKNFFKRSPIVLTTITLLSLQTSGFGQQTFNKLILPSGSFNYSEGRAMEPCPGGGYILAGTASNLSMSSDEIYLARVDDYGVPMWTKTYGGDSVSQSSANCVRVLPDGGYILCGTTNNFLGGDQDLLIMRTDSNGVLLWANSFGGSADETGYSVCLAQDGGFVACGIYGGDVTWSDQSALVVKTDSQGNLVWSTVFGKTAFQGGVLDRAVAIVALGNGGYAVTGYTENGWGGDKDILVATLTSNGAIQWVKTYGSVGGDERGYDLLETANQELVITGYVDQLMMSQAETFILSINNLGTVLWMKTYSGPDVDLGQHIFDDNGQGFIITGFTYSYGNSQQALLFKTDISGGLVWAHDLGDMSSVVINESGYDLCLNGNNIAVIATTGYFTTAMNLIVSDFAGDVLCNENNVVPLVAVYTSSAIDTLLLTVFTPALTIDNTFLETASSPAVLVNCCSWTPTAGFSHSESGLTTNVTDLSQSQTSMSTYTWYFGDGNYAFTPNASNTYLNAGTYNVCLVVTNECGSDTFCDSVDVSPLSVSSIPPDANSAYLFPNPAGDFVFVNAGSAQPVGLYLEDLHGRRIAIGFEKNSDNIYVLDTKTLGSGLYFVVLENADSPVKLKLVKM